jgi:hypothetical protein
VVETATGAASVDWLMRTIWFKGEVGSAGMSDGDVPAWWWSWGEREAWSFLEDDLCVWERVPRGYGRWGPIGTIEGK